MFWRIHKKRCCKQRKNTYAPAGDPAFNRNFFWSLHHFYVFLSSFSSTSILVTYRISCGLDLARLLVTWLERCVCGWMAPCLIELDGCSSWIELSICWQEHIIDKRFYFLRHNNTPYLDLPGKNKNVPLPLLIYLKIRHYYWHDRLQKTYQPTSYMNIDIN